MDFIMVDKEMETQVRCEFFYGFENTAVVFRSRMSEQIMNNSRNGKVVFKFSHKCSSAKDFLSYLLAIHETGQISLLRGDVVSIKINGSIMSYRFVMQGRGGYSNVWEYFTEHKYFEVEEKEEYVARIHRKNHVLDVLAGKEIGIDSIQLSDTVVCAIDGETYFPKGDRSSLVITDYFVYELKDMQIERINPYQRPFCDIHSALMFFKHNKNLRKNKCKNRLLLLNRKELYFLRDYSSLMMTL